MLRTVLAPSGDTNSTYTTTMAPHKERRRSTGGYPICVATSTIIRPVDGWNDTDMRGDKLLRQHETEWGITSQNRKCGSDEDPLESRVGASSVEATTIEDHLHQQTGAIVVCKTIPPSPHQTYKSPPISSSPPKDSPPRIIAALREQLATATAAAQRFESAAQTLQGQLTELRQASRELNEENDELVNDIHDTTQEIDELREQLDNLGRHYSTLRSKYVSLQRENEDLEDSLERSCEEGDNLDPDEVADLMDDLREQMKRKVREVVDEKSAFEQECQRLTVENRQMRDDLEQCMNEKTRVEESLREELIAAEELRWEIETNGIEKRCLPDTRLSTTDSLAEAGCGDIGDASPPPPPARQEDCSIEQETSQEERRSQYEEEVTSFRKEAGSGSGNSGKSADSGSMIARECGFTRMQRRSSTGGVSRRQRQSTRRIDVSRNNSIDSFDSWNRGAAFVSEDYEDTNKSSRTYLSSSEHGNGEELAPHGHQLNPQSHPAQKKRSISNSKQCRNSCSFPSKLPIQRFLSNSKRKTQPKPQLSEKRRPSLPGSITMMTQNSLSQSPHPVQPSQPPQLPPQPQQKQYRQKKQEQERVSASENESASLRRQASKRLSWFSSRSAQSSQHPEQSSSLSLSCTDNSHATSPLEGVTRVMSGRMGSRTSLGSSIVGSSSMSTVSSASTMQLHGNNGGSGVEGKGGGGRGESWGNPPGGRPSLIRRDSSLLSIDSGGCWIDSDGYRKDTLMVEFGPGGLDGIDDLDDEDRSSSGSSSDGSITLW